MTAIRVSVLAATLLVLAAAVACTPDPEPLPPPVAASTPVPSASPAPSSAVPAPSSASPSTVAPTAAPAPSATPGGTTTAPSPSTPVESTVAPRPERSKKAVDLDESVATGTGLTGRVVSIRGIEAEAQLPGETSGSALVITVELLNSSRQTADLTAVVVNVLDADDAPATQLTSAPTKPLPGRVAGRERARGVYVFRVPEDRRRPVTVTVSIDDAPVLVFTGNAP